MFSARIRPGSNDGGLAPRAPRLARSISLALLLACPAPAVAARAVRQDAGQQPPQQQPAPPRPHGTTPADPPPPGPQQQGRNVPPEGDPSSSGGREFVEVESDEVEVINTDRVNVLLTATDKKRQFVTTLRPEDLRVTEDGVPQEILSFERETNVPLSLVILVDTSASQERVLKDEQRAARDFARSILRPGKDAAAVLSFTGVIRLEQPPTADLARIEAAVNRVEVKYTLDSPECRDTDVPEEVRRRCTTAVWDGVAIAAAEVLARTPENTRRAVILLTDGDDTSSRLRLYQAAEYAVKHNVAVYSIGIRDEDFEVGELRRDHLRRISEETGGRAFFPKKPEDLARAFAQIESELRAQYLVTYRPTKRERDGAFRRVAVEVVNPDLRKKKLRLLYREGYYATKP